MAGGAGAGRENFGWIDKGGGVGAELGEEVAKAVDKEERHDLLFNARDERHGEEGHRWRGRLPVSNTYFS